MFTKTNKDMRNGNSSPAVDVPSVPATPSLMASDLKFTGDLISTGEVQIDGNVTGDIRADTLIIGASGNINGEITANKVRIHGKTIGQINAKSVSLAKTANVQGDILHEDLSIEQGAYLEGHCRRTEVIPEEKNSENPISLLVKGGSKTRLDTSQKKSQAHLGA